MLNQSEPTQTPLLNDTLAALAERIEPCRNQIKTENPLYPGYLFTVTCNGPRFQVNALDAQVKVFICLNCDRPERRG